MRHTPTLLRPVLAALLAAGALGACSSGDDTDGRAAAAPRPTTTSPSTTAPRPPGSSTSTVPATVTTIPATAPPSTSAPPTAPAVPPATPDACAGVRSWTTSPHATSPSTPDDFYLVRAGRHECFDRIVLDVNGVLAGPDAVGHDVAYVDGEVTGPTGAPVPTAGPAALRVVVRAPMLGTGTSGHQPWRQPPAVGDDLVPAGQLALWDTVRQVAYAGSFEGETTIALGLPARLPFRVGTIERDGYTHVYVDVAHPA